MKRLKSGVAVVGLVAGGLSALSQTASALSSAPDPTWGVKGTVYALAQYGDTMYVGGAFSKAISPEGKATAVSNIAAFSISTGNYLPSFAATVTGTTGKVKVQALAVSADGAKLYVGGGFDTVDGQPREHLAIVNAATGTQLDPSLGSGPNRNVQAIVASPSLVYLGGSFTRFDGHPRMHLAAISAADDSLSSTWVPTSTAGVDPCPSLLPVGTSCGSVSDGGTGNVHSMAFTADGNGLLLGGNFYYIDGVPRNSIAEVSLSDGSILPWKVPWSTIPSESPTAPYAGPNVVRAIVPTTMRIYVAYGRTPNGFEAFTSAITTSSGECVNGCATQIWWHGAPGNPESLALSPDGSRLFVGGHFGTAVLDFQVSSCGSTVWAHGLISVDPATGSIFCDWFPQMVPFGGKTAPGSGVNPPNYKGAWVMQMTPNALFVGGKFTSISGVPQQSVARFTLSVPPPAVTSSESHHAMSRRAAVAR